MGQIEERPLAFSVAWSGTLRPEAGGREDVVVLRRSVVWGASRAQQVRLIVRDVIAAVRTARACRAIVLCTGAVDLVPALLAVSLLARRTTVGVADVLTAPPRPVRDRILGLGLRRADLVVCIRTGDVDSLASRFGVRRDRLVFVPFPAPAVDGPATASDATTIYAAGSVHRDWATTMTALAIAGGPATVSGNDVPAPPGCDVTEAGVLAPEEGRARMARAAIVLSCLADTTLPAGPLVVLDAMAMGKAIVATDVNGNRDYVDHERTGLLVPAGDAPALAAAMTRLRRDPELRQRLGAAARHEAETRCSPAAFVDAIDAALRSGRLRQGPA